MFLSLKHSMLSGGYRRPEEPWSAEQTFKVFMSMALVTLLLTCIPTVIWLNTTSYCGPFCPVLLCGDPGGTGEESSIENLNVYEAYASFLNDIPTDEEQSIFGKYFVGILQVVTFMFNPLCQLILILVMWARYHFVSRELNASKAEMSAKVRTLDKEKDFLTEQLEQMTKK
eukprot:SAG11_NODE_9061_length_948_cov_0.910483_1_plen_170_part_10